MHQRASQVFVGDLFAEHWCIDFGLLIMTLMHACSLSFRVAWKCSGSTVADRRAISSGRCQARVGGPRPQDGLKFRGL